MITVRGGLLLEQEMTSWIVGFKIIQVLIFLKFVWELGSYTCTCRKGIVLSSSGTIELEYQAVGAYTE